MLMPKRSYAAATGYRYGFNGKENDNDVKGLGNQQDYGMRIYDPRLGRFLSVDPLTKGYPMLTPFQFASNNPILFIDLDGLEGDYFFKKDESGKFALVNYIDNGKSEPNRFFVYDGEIKGVSKYRYQHGGSSWKMALIPSSFYEEADYFNFEFLKGGQIDGQSQFDRDRRTWLVQGADFSDLNYLERLWEDHKDNPDASNMIEALRMTPGGPGNTGMAGANVRMRKMNAEEPVLKSNEKASEANGGSTSSTSNNSATRGVNNPGTRAGLNRGNQLHYDSKNGSTGAGLPTELSQKYPNTQFRFLRRGQQGADVEVVGGTHPSQYPNSTWDSKSNFGDFKPNSQTGNSRFNREVKSGKLPANTQRLNYDPATGKLL